MDFEEMKVIWDSQKQAPLYAMNQTALHAVVRRRNEEFQRSASRCYTIEIGAGLASGALMLAFAGVLAFGDPTWLASQRWMKVAISPWHVAALMTAGVIWVGFGAFMIAARKRQLRREESFTATLSGDVERALSQVAFQISTARNILRWGIASSAVAAVLWVGVAFHLMKSSTQTLIVMMVGVALAFAADAVRKSRSITKRYQPRQQELESLRNKLTEPERTT